MAVLVSWGYNVWAVEDGRRGLSIVNNNAETIDMVLLDMVLPFLSGLEIFEILKKQRPTTKCLMMAGYDEPPPGFFTRLETFRFIAKPFNLSDLHAIIEEMLPDRPKRCEHE